MTKLSRLSRLLILISKLSAMQSKELWTSGPTNHVLMEYWKEKELKLMILIKDEYERKS